MMDWNHSSLSASNTYVVSSGSRGSAHRSVPAQGKIWHEWAESFGEHKNQTWSQAVWSYSSHHIALPSCCLWFLSDKAMVSSARQPDILRGHNSLWHGDVELRWTLGPCVGEDLSSNRMYLKHVRATQTGNTCIFACIYGSRVLQHSMLPFCVTIWLLRAYG
jgi:hypothetical protein